MKTYSSGMKARVGFAIATSVDPDILLLDEVLQTGDNTFKEKSRRRIAQVLQTAKAVVMVTHDMSWITAFCNRAVLLEKGKIVADGDPDEIADMHEQDAAKRAKQKRKAKQLMLHGVASQDEIKQARKEGTLDDMIEDKTGEVEEIKAEKRRQVEEKRARRKARKAQAARAESTAGNGSAGEPPAEPKAETAEPEAVAASAKSDQGDPGTSGRS
jgi:ABC-type multidrug transport system ATPase subunit